MSQRLRWINAAAEFLCSVRSVVKQDLKRDSEQPLHCLGLHLHSGRLADAFMQSDLQLVHEIETI